MAAEWELNAVVDNRGRSLDVWRFGDYELAENVNLGLEGGWVFELTLRGVRVGLYARLSEGKRAARAHAAGGDVKLLDSDAGRSIFLEVDVEAAQ